MNNPFMDQVFTPDNFLKLAGGIFALGVTYVLGRMAKFQENKFNLMFEKYQKYDAIRNSWYEVIAYIANPDFSKLWNADTDNFRSSSKKVIIENPKIKKQEAGLFVTQGIEILTRYLDVRVLSVLTDPQTNFPVRVNDTRSLVNEMSRKLLLMEELIRYECRTDTFHFTMNDNFFDADLNTMEFRRVGKDWWNNHENEFKEMYNYYNQYEKKSPFVREVGREF